MIDDDFIIDKWQVRPASNLLINDTDEVHIEPKVMQLLVYLAKNQGEVVTREELLDNVWPQIVLSDVLNNTIANLRKALGDNQSPRCYIETIPKLGYRLIPNVSWKVTTSDQERTILQNETNAEGSTFSLSNLQYVFLIIMVILIAGFGYFQPLSKYNEIPERLVSEQFKTLAVLPFDTYNDSSELNYFADGLVEELIHQFAANPNLRVIARTSSGSFRDTKLHIREISKILGTRYIIEGSIRQSDDILRVTVQLIDAEKGYHLWSRTFDHDGKTNILKTQESISKKITTLLAADTKNTKNYSKRKHPASTEAYKFFLMAQSHMKFVEVEHLEKALDYYKQAIAIAPDYAIAYSGMAAAHLLLYQYNHTPISETQILVTNALDKAFEIEPNLAEAFAVRGLLETYLQKYRLAEKDFLKAIELNPGLRFARHNYGFMLWRLSRAEEALEQFEVALEMDPLSSITNFGVGDILGNLGELDKAIAHYKQCQELLPNNYTCFIGMANIYKLKGDFNKFSYFLQQAEMRVEDDNFWLVANKAFNALRNNELHTSMVYINLATSKKHRDYYLLKTSFLLNLKQKTMAPYTKNIKHLLIETPNDFDLNLLLGQAFYFEQNCTLAIAQYELGEQGNGRDLFEIWDFSEGFAHSINLAYCYQQTNQHKLAKAMLANFHQFIQTLPTSAHSMPGKIYNEARYLMLLNKPNQAKNLLESIKDWPLIWLVDSDPIWHS